MSALEPWASAGTAPVTDLAERTHREHAVAPAAARPALEHAVAYGASGGSRPGSGPGGG